MLKQICSKNGFTLIELVVVILFLGVIAVVAAPKFIDFSSEARKSTIEQAAGAIKSAIKIVNLKAQIEGVANAASTELSTDNTVIELKYGYPDARNGIKASVNLGKIGGYGARSKNSQYDWITHNVSFIEGGAILPGLEFGLGSYSGDGSSTDKAPSPRTLNCFIRYIEASANKKASIIVFTDGC
ncbi:type II secretion system protein [Parashewanella spongiae]|uniref:Type II secretion system protein n=1 Tax=Parashewanella spongiae TaxID=342950 RepID=A0A3A6TF93_9GAMM|nr:prepilin-type N-terminal cleavage/methylation domain-containing protein [Parashewanella spongiae]MCL1079510.1 prepilin-type N-terminal cleavage/methylation domain-containing protein [Parashewanella spongiae]RJY07504.1 type II secretion system protein [Parashewanella spongiae]